MPLAELQAAPYNPRKALRPGDSEYQRLRRSLEEFGFVDPVVFNTQTKHLVGGHQRLTVWRDLGHTTAPAALVDLDLAREKVLNVALNKIAGQWDMTALRELLLEFGSEATLSGFDPDEIDDLVRRYADDDSGEDEPVPAPPETAVTQPGDLYELGPHRLLCGDATNPATVARLMAGRRARMLWTDPPYGVGYVGASGLAIANDTADGLDALLGGAFAAVDPHLSPGAALYIASPGGRLGMVFRQAFVRAGWLFHQDLVWVKNSLVVGHADYQHQHELVMYGWRPGKAREWWGNRDQATVFDDERPIEEITLEEFRDAERARRTGSDVLREKRPSSSAEHPTMKPIPLVRRMVENSSGPGEVVLDVFAGSGSTLIAAHELHRTCYALELDGRYCDVIVRRWENLTGGQVLRIPARGAA